MEKKANLRGEVLLSPTRVKKELHDYIKLTAKKRGLSMTTVIQECISFHKDFHTAKEGIK